MSLAQRTRTETAKIMKNAMRMVAATLLLLGATPSWSQGAMPGMDHGGTGGMDHGRPGDATMSQPEAPKQPAPGSDLRDPHAYSDGYDFGAIPRPRMGDEHSRGALLVERLERAFADDGNATAYDLQAWYGRDYDRAVIKTEGERSGGALQDARTELLWGHAIAAYWDAQLGLRHDSGAGPGRTWLAFGIQGLAPYWFELEASGYLGQEGRSALRLAASYELLFTQKLVLQPRVEADVYGKSDPERELGSRLSSLTAGLRLRYEVRREFAPYVGVEWSGKFGDTADLARIAGAPTRETRVVAGVRFWF